MKNTIRLLGILLITLTSYSCGENTIDYEKEKGKIQTIEDVVYYKEKPFTGIIKYESTYTNDIVSYKNGLKNGIKTTYYKNGKLKEKMTYEKDTLVKEYVKYRNDVNSNLEVKIDYINKEITTYPYYKDKTVIPMELETIDKLLNSHLGEIYLEGVWVDRTYLIHFK